MEAEEERHFRKRIATLFDGHRLIQRSVVVVGSVSIILPVGARVVPIETSPT